MLTLSERLVKRTVDSRAEKGVRPSAEEQRLYLALLQEQGKLEEALVAVIAHGDGEAPLGTKAVSAEAVKIIDEDSLEATGVPSEFLMMQPQVSSLLMSRCSCISVSVLYSHLAVDCLFFGSKERLELEAKLRMSARGDFSGAYACYKTLLGHAPEQWSFYVGLLDALFATMTTTKSNNDTADGAAPTGGGGGGGGAGTDWGEEAEVLIKEARPWAWALQQGNPRSRAPFLVELELLRRWGLSGRTPIPETWVKKETTTSEGDGDDGDRTDLVCAYIDRFSSKPCCFLDLKPYLAMLKSSTGSETRDGLVRALSTKASSSSDDLQSSGTAVADRVALLHKHICCCQCLRFLGEPKVDDAAALKAEAARLFALYRATLDVNEGAAGGQREVQHGDELVLLAVHILRDLASTSQSDGDDVVFRCHLDAALLLEYGLECSPFNYHMKIELLSVYQALGAFESGVSLFNDLNIRHVQVDSLSWLLLPGCVACGLFTEAQKQLREVLRVHRSSRRGAYMTTTPVTTA
jgi:N-terminal acetyltransferase B complex non-catalytic subunit